MKTRKSKKKQEQLEKLPKCSICGSIVEKHFLYEICPNWFCDTNETKSIKID